MEETIGSRIKLTREAVGISQSQMGRLLGCGKSFLSAVENDKSKITIEQLINLVVHYGVNSNYILVGKGSMFIAPDYNDVQDEFEKKVVEIMKKQGVLK